MTLIPTSLAAFALVVDEATIRKWSERGKLTRHGSERRAMWDLTEVTALAKARDRDGDTRSVRRVA